MQKNIIMGPSMGGLVARYALRDLELDGKTHDTRLYVSFDTPHQGANFPLGFQAMVSHMNGMGIGVGLPGIYYYPPGLQFGNLIPQIGKSFKLLNSPAARQMLYYSVVGNGHLILVDNSIHDAFMADYKQKGYPVQGGIRNLVIANGSECGTDQGYPPHSEYINFTNKTTLNWWQNLLGNVLSPLTILTSYPQAGFGGFLTTRTEIKNQFIINALPNQQAKRVYYGRMYIKKKILFVINVNITLFEKSFSSLASHLPIDNAGGGVRDLEEFAEDMPFELKRSRFCFVPTFSALDIGGGLQPITYNEVTRSFSATAPPTPPKNVVASNFFTNPSEAGISNEIHPRVTLRNGRWLFQEITGTPAFFSCAYQCADPTIGPTIIGPDLICSGTNIVFTSTNLPSGSALLWSNSANLNYVSGQSTSAYTVINPNAATKAFGSLSLNITGVCQTRSISKTVWIGKPATVNNIWFNGTRDDPPFQACKNTNYNFEANDPMNIAGTSYSWIAPGIGTIMSGQGTAFANIKMFNSVNSGYVSVTPYNTCGYGTIFDATINVSACSGGGRNLAMSIFPNPASEELMVTYAEDSARHPNDLLPEILQIDLINSRLERVFSTRTQKNRVTIPVNKLPKGIYYIQVQNREGIIQRQVIIDH